MAWIAKKSSRQLSFDLEWWIMCAKKTPYNFGWFFHFRTLSSSAPPISPHLVCGSAHQFLSVVFCIASIYLRHYAVLLFLFAHNQHKINNNWHFDPQQKNETGQKNKYLSIPIAVQLKRNSCNVLMLVRKKNGSKQKDKKKTWIERQKKRNEKEEDGTKVSNRVDDCDNFAWKMNTRMIPSINPAAHARTFAQSTQVLWTEREKKNYQKKWILHCCCCCCCFCVTAYVPVLFFVVPTKWRRPYLPFAFWIAEQRLSSHNEA